MRKLRTLVVVFLLVLTAGIPVHAVGFQKITGTAKKSGLYNMWIDKNSRLHIRKPSAKKDLASIVRCNGGVSDGKTIYYWNGNRNRMSIFQYSILSRSRKRIAHFRGIHQITGAYKKRLILEGCLPSESTTMDSLYVYDTKTGKIKRIRQSCECAGIYNQFFVFKGTTGAISSTRLGVYNAETNKSKILTDKCWYMVQNGSQIYFANEVSNTSSYVVRKLKIYRYSMMTGKKKGVSKTVTVSVLENNHLSKGKFTYFDENGIKRTLRF